MRTITINDVSGEGILYRSGWKTLTIRTAKYGKQDSGNPFIDIWFENYPDNFNHRTWAQTGDNGEEWCIARLFRYANAGIVDALDEDGQKRATLNDDAEQLIGKTINILFYKDDPDAKGVEYGRAYLVPAPTVFTNVVDTFTEAKVAACKASAIENWRSRGVGSLPEHVLDPPSTNGHTNGHLEGETTTEGDKEAAELPF